MSRTNDAHEGRIAIHSAARYCAADLGTGNILLGICFVKILGLSLLVIALGSAVTMLIRHAISVPFFVKSHVDKSLRLLFVQACLRALAGAIPTVLAALLILLYWPAGSLLVVVQMALCGLVYAAGIWYLSMRVRDREKVNLALQTPSPDKWAHYLEGTAYEHR